MPKVSVLMPAYNAEKYISEAIESILNQTFSDFEFIIIDDGSSDSTWEIIQKYTERDSRIVAIKNEENLGISKSRNILVKNSRSEYIAWQDADDISLKNRLQLQVQVLDSNINIGICGGGLQFFSDNNNISKRLYKTSDEELRKTIFRYSPISQGSSTYRKSAILEAGKYNENLSTAEDLDLTFRIGKKYLFSNVSNIVLRYRQHESDTFKNLRTMELETIKMRWKYNDGIYYSMNLFDKIYNIAQFLSIYIIPRRVKIKIFNLIRNS